MVARSAGHDARAIALGDDTIGATHSSNRRCRKPPLLTNIEHRLREWEHLGVKTSADGARLIAHTPRDFPQAYLHAVFAPAPASAWEGYGLRLPEHLQALYGCCNGLMLFGALTLWGVRAHYARDASAQFQPFDLTVHHTECIRTLHPLAAEKADHRVFFGNYSDDGAALYTLADSPRVYVVAPDTSEPFASWASVGEFLESEYDRLDQMFTRDGYQSDDEVSTTFAAADAHRVL